mmetsp:Transcript_30161/g.39733  ORF Transcript_30161/g.39733 Transcript_30161/m.39733 type:complete len:486 (+) Transcript_30161:53-1510(+)
MQNHNGDQNQRGKTKPTALPVTPLKTPIKAKIDMGSDEDKSPKPPPVSPKMARVEPEYEFGGPLGSLGVMVFLPLVIYMLYYLCGKDYCLNGLDVGSLSEVPFPKTLEQVQALFSLEALLVFLGWFGFQVLLDRTLPGEVAKGVMLKTKTRLDYRLNGHLAFWVSLGVMAHGMPEFSNEGWNLKGMGRLPLSYLYDNYLQLITASTLFSFVLSTWLYVRSARKNALLADGGQTGSPVYDYFIGRELNPRTGGFDWKCFCELRPGLIGWVVLNMGMAAKQYENNGCISGPMILINLFQAFYVWDSLYMERAILTTMDITTDGFGFMLAFGDLAWVPFTYSLQARYLVDHDPGLSHVALAGITCLHFLGYAIFRGANSQKDAFRRDPTAPGVSHLKTLDTKRGTRLLVSGWWGLARKINYTGDWIIGLSWCLLCGFNSIVPYFYAIYFAVLLVHRSFRDDHACKLKYGDDWEIYKKLVPAKFIPWIF